VPPFWALSSVPSVKTLNPSFIPSLIFSSIHSGSSVSFSLLATSMGCRAQFSLKEKIMI
jgi:hypothetical protein